MSNFHKKLGIFRYIMPSYYIEVLTVAVDELSNYSFYKKTLEVLDKTGEAKKNHWKISDEDNSINFAVNLQPETLLYSDNDVQNYEMSVVSNTILKTDSALSEYSLFGMVEYNTERIYNEDYYGYGITGTYKLNKIKKSDIVYLSVYSAVLAISIAVFGIIFLF